MLRPFKGVNLCESYVCLQVVLLSQGHLMYAGGKEGIAPWFSDTLGLAYNPARQGVVCDWMMDLVNIGFANNPRVGSQSARLKNVCSALWSWLNMNPSEHRVPAAADCRLLICVSNWKMYRLPIHPIFCRSELLCVVSIRASHSQMVWYCVPTSVAKSKSCHMGRLALVPLCLFGIWQLVKSHSVAEQERSSSSTSTIRTAEDLEEASIRFVQHYKASEGVLCYSTSTRSNFGDAAGPAAGATDLQLVVQDRDPKIPDTPISVPHEGTASWQTQMRCVQILFICDNPAWHSLGMAATSLLQI